MADPSITCPNCQATVDAGTRFCGSCGKPVVVAEAPKASPMARTMMGMDATAVAAAAERARAVMAASAASAATAATAALPAVGAPPPTAATPAAVSAGARAGKLPARTMLGISAAGLPIPAAAPAAAPVAAAAPAPAPAKLAARTMLGISAAELAGPPAAATPAAPAAAPGGRHGNLPARTMIGGGIGSFGAPAGNPAPAAPAAGGGGRTMLGVPLATSPSVPPEGAPQPQPGVRTGSFDSGDLDNSGDGYDQRASGSVGSEIDTEMTLPRPAARPAWLLIVLGVLALAIVAFVVVRMRGGGSHSDVSAKIVTIDTGEALLFEVPAAPAGSKVRFGGQEKPLTAGRATFALAADSLRVGDNVVLADVVYPTGETEAARVTLAVFYRIWVDTAALRDDKSSVDVVVTALPGTKVTLDGQDLKLDAEGRATRTYPLDVQADAKGGVIDHIVHYRLQPPSGETVVDELHTQIPVAMMQIDRPGRALVTDRESIEVAGAVGKDTKVSIDGTSVPIKDGRFLYRFPLPKPETYKPRVVATAAGKAPNGATLEIRRVRSLEEASEEFVADRELTFAKIAPNPSIYRGQKISLEGRVYATDPHGGESVIQMFARPCPGSQRCSVWVMDPAATEVAVDSWIRVLGTVEGEQQFRSEKNDVVTVPKVRASFVLPAKP